MDDLTRQSRSYYSGRRRPVRNHRRGDHYTHAATLENRHDAQRAPPLRLGFSIAFRDCAQVQGSLSVQSGDFPVEFDEGGGLKNRCRFERKSWIPQVLTSRTLSVCGEVAERLKAAVC